MKLENYTPDFAEDTTEKELGISDYVFDAFAAPVRGLEGLAHGVYNLGDFLSFDMLPDWDEQRFFGRSQTLPGSLIEGLTQFAVPFGIIGKGISVAGKAARAGQLTGVAGKAAKAVTKGAKPGQFTDLSWKGYLGAEMASDFVAFDGQEERLSNLIQQFPELQNPITEYLAADPDDNEAMGRVKNVLEGVLVGLGVGAVAKSVMAGINAIKTKNVELQKGADREDAITTAMMKWGDETKELELAQRMIRRRHPMFARKLDDSTLKLIREGYKKETINDTTYETISPEGKTAPTVENVLKSLSKNADLPEVQTLAKDLNKLIKDVNDKNVLITFSDEAADPSKIRGQEKASDVLGSYSLTKDRITLFTAASDEQTIVHEILHGVTAKKVNAWVKSGGKDRALTLQNIDNVIKNKQAPKPIRGLASAFKEAEKELKSLKYGGVSEGETLYAFKDLDEFLVAAFTDYDLQKILRRMPSSDRRTIFQKIIDSVKDLLGYTTRAEGSLLDKVLRDSSQIISAGRPEYMGKARLVDLGLYAQALSKAGKSVTSTELEQFRKQKKIPEIKLRKTGAHPTQIATTKATYEKVKAQLKEGSTIDFGAGKNIAVKAGIKADSFEPFPEKGFEPTFKDSSKIASNSYDNVINNAVLNVVPQDIRDNLVSEIGRILKVGGKAFINVRGKDVFDSKHTLISKENMEVIVDSTGAYQKGFTKEELVGYLSEVLGDGFDVKVSTKFGTVAAEVTKRADEGLASVRVVDDLIDDTDVPSFKVGGKQSLTGVVKTMAKLPKGMYPQELAGIAEQTANKLLQDSTKMAKLSQEMLDEGVVNELADAMGTDGKMLNSLVQQASKDKQELFRITARMKALESMLTANGKEILDVAEQYKKTKGKVSEDELEMTEARLKTLIEQQLHIQASQSGLASGFGRGLKSRQMGVKIGLSEREISDTKLRQDYLNKRGGMTVDNIVENILLAKNGNGDDLWNTIIAMNKTVRGAEGGKFMDMVQEYYKNSLMWGPRTLTVNALGGALSSSIKNFERYIGGWFSAGPEVKQAVVNSWAQGMQMKDLVRFMLNAWKSGDHYIGDAGSAFVEQTGGSIGSITAKNVERMRGKEIESDGIKQFIDYFGNVIRVPNRFNTSVDQMYKFNEYKTRAVAQLTLKAYELGIRDSEKVAEYVTDSLNALVTRSNRNFSQSNLIKEANETFKPEQFATPADREKAIAEYVEGRQQEVAEIARQQQLVGTETRDNDFMALEQLARDWVDPNIRSADEVTFSGQLGKNMQKLQSFVNGVPFAFVVAPFIRTPTNILKFSFSRLLAPAEAAYNGAKYLKGGEYKDKIDALLNNKAPALEKTRKSLMEQMVAVKPDGTPDLLTRAEARGRLASGTIMTAALASVVSMYKDRINGGGPKDYKQRQAWQAAGNMPYSIRVGDKWISYQRLDPVATMIGVFADMADLIEDGKMHSIDSNIFEKVMAASMLTVTRNATNKSYLAGIDKFFSFIFDPESTSAGKYLGGVAGGFIPNILNQGQSIAGDQELKETRTFVDVIAKRIPGVAMDLKRNPLGEPVVQEYFEGAAGIINPLNPIMWGSKKDDPVLTELANVAHGFSAPSAKLEGLIDLTNYDGPNDRSAYDRWLELHSKVKINNLTLRQALTKLINSKQYKALDPQSFSGLPSPRVDYLRRVMGRYRQKAKLEMLKEFPEIMRLQQEVRRGKRTQRTEDVLELLTQ